MPREVTMEEQSAAVRVVPPTRQQLSTAHLRSLLNALRHTPVSVIQRVGFLLVLVVSVVEASGLTDCASSAISIAGSAAGAAARDGIVITKDEQERAVKILAIAKANWARVTDLVGVEEEGSALGAVPVLEMETLRRWAVRRNRGVPRLLCLLRAAPDIGLDDALLVQHHAAEISPREAGKVKNKPALCLEIRRYHLVDEPSCCCTSIVQILRHSTGKHSLEECKIRTRKASVVELRLPLLYVKTLYQCGLRWTWYPASIIIVDN